MRALAATALGGVLVELESGDAELVDEEPPAAAPVEVSLPLVVAADQIGARIAAVVDRRPPLMLSDDAGLTWREAGGGLPSGTAVAIHPDEPDCVVFASDSRLFLSEDGGRFWRALETEMIGITAVVFL